MTTGARQPTAPAAKSMDDIMALCKRRGFIYPASEIYGGINGFWDYGPLGAQLKKNLRDAWWRDVVEVPPIGPDGAELRIVPLDTCVIQNPKVWEASGHVAGFHDAMVTDRETGQRFRADHLYGIFSESDRMVASGGSDDPTEQGRHVEQWREILPNRTVIAANADEAASRLVGDKTLRKQIGLRSIEVVEVGHGPMEWIKVQVDFGGGRTEFAWIKWVGKTPLERAPEKISSPFTGRSGALSPPRAFNLMFQTYVGATATEDDKAYLRPETAQGIFINFKNVWDSTRVKIPFGIAQVGKAFRNEVTPRNFTFRSREFEQMEIEFFCPPDAHRAASEKSVREWYEFWVDERLKWWKSVGLSPDNLQLREHATDELAHYAKEGAGTTDIEYRFPFTAPGFGELEGVADRTDYDLRQHQDASKAKLEIFDQERNARYLPNVIEPSAGLDRGVLALLCDAYTPDADRPSKVYLKFHPRVAPIKAAVFPLVAKEGMPEVAAKLARSLKQRFGFIESDAKQSIGKRYARMDEAGCPFCFTIDGATLEDQTVTVRDRDTAGQERLHIDKVETFLEERLRG